MQKDKKEAHKVQKTDAGVVRQPTPFSTNPGWAEEIRLGPGPPARKSRADKFARSVEDAHPPIVGTPRNPADVQWMLQPPPTAKVMAGKEQQSLRDPDPIRGLPKRNNNNNNDNYNNINNTHMSRPDTAPSSSSSPPDLEPGDHDPDPPPSLPLPSPELVPQGRDDDVSCRADQHVDVMFTDSDIDYLAHLAPSVSIQLATFLDSGHWLSHGLDPTLELLATEVHKREQRAKKVEQAF